MKTLGAIAMVICLVTAGCGYHGHYHRYGFDRYGRRAEIRRAQADFRREMRAARRDFHDQFGRW